MAWTAPRDWAVAETLTAANMDTYVSDNLAYLKAITLSKGGCIPYPYAYYNIAGSVCPVYYTPAAITMAAIRIGGRNDGTVELDVSLCFCDDLDNYSGRTVIDVCDTTGGSVTITSGMDDATVPAGKWIYWEFGALPSANWPYMAFQVHYTVD